MSETRLFDYWRSSASYRVRIALNLCGIAHDRIEVDLVAGEQSSETHLGRNPQGFVPVLEIDGIRLTQSLAIIEYLAETRNIAFLPAAAPARAWVRALAHVIAMDTHPICNTSIAAEVVRISGATGSDAEAVRVDWMRKFIRRGLRAFEGLLEQGESGEFCHGDEPGLADICLMPQLYNAERWGADVSDLKRIREISRNCSRIPAFANAHPDRVKPG